MLYFFSSVLLHVYIFLYLAPTGAHVSQQSVIIFRYGREKWQNYARNFFLKSSFSMYTPEAGILRAYSTKANSVLLGLPVVAWLSKTLIFWSLTSFSASKFFSSCGLQQHLLSGDCYPFQIWKINFSMLAISTQRIRKPAFLNMMKIKHEKSQPQL